MADIRQSQKYQEYLQKLGWHIDELKVKNEKLKIYVRKLPLLGNFIKIHHPPVALTNNDLKELAKRHKAFSIQVTFSPSKTLILDLKPDLKKIFNNFSKDTRYEIRKAQKNNIKVGLSNDISAFAKMWTETALRRHFWIPFEKEIKILYESFGDKAYLFFAFCSNDSNHDNKPLAGTLVLVHDNQAHYFHAASTLEGRKLQAPSLIVWEAIKLAKKKGCTKFDFEGIFDPRDKDTKNWQGFTRFKKGFGGKEVEYPLTKTKFYFLNFQL